MKKWTRMLCAALAMVMVLSACGTPAETTTEAPTTAATTTEAPTTEAPKTTVAPKVNEVPVSQKIYSALDTAIMTKSCPSCGKDIPTDGDAELEACPNCGAKIG